MFVFILESQKSLSELEEILKACGGHIFLKPIYHFNEEDNSYYESNRKLVGCSERTIKQLQLGYHIKVNTFDWDRFRRPLRSESWNLHLSGFPRGMASTEVVALVQKILDPIIDSKDYQVIIPEAKDKESGDKILGYGTLKFGEEVSQDMKMLCKLVMNHTLVGEQLVACVWKRKGHSKQFWTKAEKQVAEE